MGQEVIIMCIMLSLLYVINDRFIFVHIGVKVTLSFHQLHFIKK